jgi:hypothetical protein
MIYTSLNENAIVNFLRNLQILPIKQRYKIAVKVFIDPKKHDACFIGARACAL